MGRRSYSTYNADSSARRQRTRGILGFLLAAASTLNAADEKKDENKWDVNNPPGEAATVTIDTRTGTWMSVDVSPDGRTLVFDLLGDLYALPIKGGEARPLTHSIAWDMQPRFSLDGSRIAFVSDAGGGDNVWLMDADGKDKRPLTSEEFRLVNNPVWHPGGDAIAVRKHFTGTRSLGSGEIWLYHIGGGKGLALMEKPNWQKDLGEPAFSPDGRYVYFSQDTTPGRVFQYNKNSRRQIYQIQRLDLADGKIEPLVSGPGGAVRPVPSPDGLQLAFVRRLHGQSTLFVKNLNSGQETAVWNGLDRDLQEAWAIHGVYPSFAWLPGSREVVIWAQGRLWRVTVPRGEARPIPFHVKDTRDVRTAVRFSNPVAPPTFDVKQLRWVNVSPGGDKVVYSALGYLHVKDLPNGEPTRVTNQSDHFEFYPKFSRDGRSLVFVTWNDETLGTVRRLDLTTAVETVLTREPGKYIEPVFSPDGRSVVYVKASGGKLTSPWYSLDPGVYSVAADGTGQPRRLTKDGGAPQFGATGDRVYITRSSVTNEVDLQTVLVSVPMDGGEERDVVKSERALEFSVSPDGGWIAFVEGFQVYVEPWPQTGRELDVGPKVDALPLRRLSVRGGEYVHWSGDSERVHFALGNQLFTCALKDSFVFLPRPTDALAEPSAQGIPLGFTQELDVPASSLALTGARIVTMRGDEVIENGTIVVRGNRIAAVGPSETMSAPTGAIILDLAGKTIIPGLVDVHWHGSMSDFGIIPQQSWIDYASLAFGVTTVHDPDPADDDMGAIFTHAEMQRAGVVVAPRIFSTGTMLYGAKSRITATIDSLGAALGHVERLKAAGAISVKSYNQPRRDQRQRVLEAARRAGMLVVPEGGSLFQHDMTMVVDGHTTVEHAIPLVALYDDVTQLWSGTAVGYTPTLGVAYGGLVGENYFYATSEVWKHPLLTRYVPLPLLEARAVRREIAPEEDFNVIRSAQAATVIQRAGVRVSIGGHGQREGLGSHWEMWMLVKGGLSPLEAIRCATLNPAQVLGLDADIGSLVPGKLADLMVIDGNPLADIRQSDRVSYIILNGRLYEAATMTEVGATRRRRRPFFFEQSPGGYVPLGVGATGHSDGR